MISRQEAFLFNSFLLAVLLVGANQTGYAGIIDLSQYNDVYYVSMTGNDTNDGTVNNPFASVSQAIDAAANSGDAIYISSGQYDVTQVGAANAIGTNSGLNNNGKNVDFIGVPNETRLLIDGASTGSRDLHFYSGKGFSKIYNIIFERDSNNRSTNYSNAFFGSNGPVRAEIYNSVFKSINSPNSGLTYDNTNSLDIKVFNSVFDLESDMVSSYSGRLAEVVNSVSNRAFMTNDGTNVHTSILSNAVFDGDYKILSETSLWQDVGVGLDHDGSIADLGVYGSSFSWDSATVPEPTTLAIWSLLGGIGLVAGHRRRRRKTA